MFYALNRFVVACLLLVWSLAAWAFHSIAAWTITNTGNLAGGVGSIEALQVPGWLAPWVPSEYASGLMGMISSFIPAMQAVLEWIPSVAGGLSVAVWTVWGLGAVLLIAMGLLATGLISLLRRQLSTSPTSS
jgi:hypothetical protein